VNRIPQVLGFAGLGCAGWARGYYVIYVLDIFVTKRERERKKKKNLEVESYLIGASKVEADWLSEGVTIEEKVEQCKVKCCAAAR
jgi:hypothetical protein